MNMTVIDITKLKDPKIGEEVIVYSSKTDDENSITNTASLVRTIPYELLIHIDESVYREVKENFYEKTTKTGEFTFVDEFFEDTALAIQRKAIQF